MDWFSLTHESHHSIQAKVPEIKEHFHSEGQNALAFSLYTPHRALEITVSDFAHEVTQTYSLFISLPTAPKI